MCQPTSANGALKESKSHCETFGLTRREAVQREYSEIGERNVGDRLFRRQLRRLQAPQLKMTSNERWKCASTFEENFSEDSKSSLCSGSDL
jgi:hypothetical protein